MEQARLDAILAQHAEWVASGGERGTRADLTSANLRSADLTSANLRSADLTSANLTSANLRSADLTSANLRSANLYGANLRSADLTSANLYGANLTSANLRSADLTSANLTSANLRSADLTSANLYGANVNGVLGRRLMSVGPVGSRNGLLIYDADADMVYAGCWRSSLADLLERVEAVYPEGSQHRAGYLLAIEWLIRALAL